jgi:hypothetical protein
VDQAIWATWYDLAEPAEDEYLDWLHSSYLPSMLARSGYLWACHVKNVTWPEREAQNDRRLLHTDDPSVPAGFRYLLMFGAPEAGVFLDPSPAELASGYSDETRRMLGLHENARSAIFLEVARVDGAEARAPGITPGPVIQFGTFNVTAESDETEMNTWYARSRLPLVEGREGNVGARKLVSIAGWPKHGILYEFASLEAAQQNLIDPSDWTKRVVDGLLHAPHSPTLGERIWPPAVSSAL